MLVHNEVADDLSENVAFTAAIKDGISQSHDQIRCSVRRYATETHIPHVVQDAENEVAEQGQDLVNTLQEQRKNTTSELLSLRKLVTAAAAEN